MVAPVQIWCAFEDVFAFSQGGGHYFKSERGGIASWSVVAKCVSHAWLPFHKSFLLVEISLMQRNFY